MCVCTCSVQRDGVQICRKGPPVPFTSEPLPLLVSRIGGDFSDCIFLGLVMVPWRIGHSESGHLGAPGDLHLDQTCICDLGSPLPGMSTRAACLGGLLGLWCPCEPHTWPSTSISLTFSVCPLMSLCGDKPRSAQADCSS